MVFRIVLNLKKMGQFFIDHWSIQGILHGSIPLGHMVVITYANPQKRLKAEVYRQEVQNELFILVGESGWCYHSVHQTVV